MKIYVQFPNMTHGCVSSTELDDLINDGHIIAFRRDEGWVNVATGPLRVKDKSQEYSGPERRTSTVAKNCLTCLDFTSEGCTSTGYCPLKVSNQTKAE